MVEVQGTLYHYGKSGYIEGKGTVAVAPDGIRWAIKGGVLRPGRAGVIMFAQLQSVSRTMYGVAIQHLNGTLKISTSPKATDTLILELAVETVQDERSSARSEEPVVRDSQAPLSIDEIKFLMVLWGGLPLYAGNEADDCHGGASELRAESTDDEAVHSGTGELEGGFADDRCVGSPVYTFSAAELSLCANHLRLKARQLRATATRQSIDADARVRRAVEDPDFPTDDEIIDAFDYLVDGYGDLE